MTEKQRKLDERYLRMARIWAENSYCQRRQVGALVVKDKMIISDGYNGTPSGFERQMPLPNWPAAIIIAMALPSILLRHPVLSVPN